MKYYINKNAQSTGEHEVHKEICEHFPNESNREILGEFLNCKEAIIYAKNKFREWEIDGCYYCCNECHKK